MDKIRRGDIFYANLPKGIGSEQTGKRPVLIIQNNHGNEHSGTVICAEITSQLEKKDIPTHVNLYGIVKKNSIILLEQIKTIDKMRLLDKLGHLNEYMMNKVDKAIKVSLGLIKCEQKDDIFEKHKEIIKAELNEAGNIQIDGEKLFYNKAIAKIIGDASPSNTIKKTNNKYRINYTDIDRDQVSFRVQKRNYWFISVEGIKEQCKIVDTTKASLLVELIENGEV